MNCIVCYVSAAQNSEQNFVPQPTFNITPGNVEFFMEVGPGSITIDSLETSVVTNGNTGGSPGGIDPSGKCCPDEYCERRESNLYFLFTETTVLSV
jgi:hypothetical protein